MRPTFQITQFQEVELVSLSKSYKTLLKESRCQPGSLFHGSLTTLDMPLIRESHPHQKKNKRKKKKRRKHLNYPRLK